ncbi:MAG: hypothetical protein KY445_14695 [Armatimonadetes bacterium]|nr:hypothetical protein [Armatimonadota bacterium]
MSSSNPKPRRAGAPPKARSAARADERTVDITPPRRASRKAAPSAGDAGTRRRAAKKKEARRNNLLALCVVVVVTGLVAGATQKVWPEYQEAKAHVAQKNRDLATLKAELESGKRRLGAISSVSGKERVLVENGFIQSGDRLLLFPKDPPQSKIASE